MEADDSGEPGGPGGTLRWGSHMDASAWLRQDHQSFGRRRHSTTTEPDRLWQRQGGLGAFLRDFGCGVQDGWHRRKLYCSWSHEYLDGGAGPECRPGAFGCGIRTNPPGEIRG